MKDTRYQEKSSPEPSGTARKVKKPRKITADYLRNSGQFYLEKFPASVAHFRRIMQMKIKRSCIAHPETDMQASFSLLEDVITKFTELGFLNDQLLAKGLLYSWKQRGWSQRRILSSLARKGISNDVIEEMSETGDAGTDMVSAARWVRKKRLGAYALKEEGKQGRWLASLARAGFDYETSRKALELSRDDIERMIADAPL